MSSDNMTPPPWLPRGAPFDADAPSLLVGDFDVETATGPLVGAPGALHTVMRLRAADDGGITGVDEDLDPDRSKVSRWPVDLRADTLHVGSAVADSGLSEYQVQWVSVDGFCGQWRTRQPDWLRDQQPGHPEVATGPFLARRRSGPAERLPNVR
jgi:hypothetical protein